MIKNNIIIKESSERIKTLITEMVATDNYWGYLFSKINRKKDNNVSAAFAVCPEIDGTISLLYNTNYIEISDDECIKDFLEHEGTHILNKHIPRLLRIISDETLMENKIKKRDKWNIAADCAVNSLIPKIKRKYSLSNGEDYCLVFPDYYNLPFKESAEFYYNNLPKDSENKNGNGEKLYKIVANHESWTKNNSKISDISSLASRLEQFSNSVLEESYKNVRNRGKLPSYIIKKIEEILKPPQIPYYQLISKLVKGSRLSKYKKAYTRINKKRIYTFFINGNHNIPKISPFPGKVKDYTFNISILLDTSGSMSKDDILEGLSGVKNIIENDKDCKTTVIENDAKIQKEYEIKKLKDIQYDIMGRGGTSLFPGLERCKELNSDVILVFTDGYCEDLNGISKKLLPRKIIYVLTKDGTSNYIDRTGYIVRLSK